jgi:hypothetical protein
MGLKINITLNQIMCLSRNSMSVVVGVLSQRLPRNLTILYELDSLQMHLMSDVMVQLAHIIAPHISRFVFRTGRLPSGV